MTPAMMRAARLHKVTAPMVIDHVPLPAVRETDIRVRVHACSIVPNLQNVLSRWKSWNPHLPLPALPAVFGLDAAGVVDHVGAQVQHFAAGDRVYVNPGMGCGSCVPCLRGRENDCADYIFAGYFGFGPNAQRLFDAYPGGGLAEYLIAPQRNLVRLPANVSYEQAARFGYLGTSFMALKRSGAGPGSTLVIDGATGTLGLGAVLNALALDVGRILGTARNKDLLARVKALAPDRIETWSLDDGPAGAWIRERTGGVGADAALNCLGPASSAHTVIDTVYALRRGARFVNIGGTKGEIPLDLFRLMAAQIDILGSNWFATSAAQEMADLAGLGRLDLSVFQHRRFALAEVNAALASIRDGNGGFTNLVVIP